jgi:hypothetical protein
MPKDKCDDCPAVADRREADATFRAVMSTKLEGLSAGVEEIKTTVWTAIGETRGDIKKLYFRIGIISGASGAVGGVIAALITTAIHN